MFKFKRFTPDLSINNIYDISLSALNKIGIKGLIFDLDNTITKHDCLDIPRTALAWFASLSDHGFNACLLSNNKGERVADAAKKLSLDFVCRARKPSKEGFYQAFKVLGTTAKQTAVIGDQLFTDIWGGNRVGALTILVEPVDACELWGTRHISRRGEKAIWPFVQRNLYNEPSEIAKLHKQMEARE